jgi:hypothetical protein
MAASSVTGTGQGISNGKYKPENHGSCPCGVSQKRGSTEPPTLIKKNKCFLKHKIC